MSAPLNSTFKYTDANVTPFVVKPYTANGPATPSSTLLYANPDGASAVSANTSLVLVGRGVPDYGEVVQANMVYLLENFANKTRPSFPTIGQLWYKKQDFGDTAFPTDPVNKGLYIWNGTTWDAVITQNAKSTQLDLNGNRIINVGDAVLATDALNVRSAASRFVNLAGSNLSGAFDLVSGTFHVENGAILSTDTQPSADSHVVNLAYLNVVSDALNSQINTTNQRIDNIQSSGDVYATTSGATFTGNVILTDAATLVLQSGGQPLSMNGRLISGLGEPVDIADASTKQYVDNTASNLQTSINNVSSSVDTLRTDTANTYARMDGATFTGSMIFGSTADVSLLSGANASFGSRRLQNVGAPTASTDAATKQYVDTTVASANMTRRYVTTQTVAGTTVFSLPSNMAFTVETQKLVVYQQGLKLVANTRGQSSVTITGTNLNGLASTGLTANTSYSVNVTVDGGTATALTITTGSASPSFNSLISLLNSAASTASLNVFFRLDAYSSTSIEIDAISFTNGVGSSIVLSYDAGSLFQSISGSAAPVATDGVVYQYFEVGNTGASSTSVQLVTAPATNDVLEFVLMP